jgi:archaellum biogenesis ATPase FlaH
MQQTIPNRIVIYAKDVMNITGRKERPERQLLTKIKKKYNKKREDFISIDEFCEFTTLPLEKVNMFLSI